LFAIPIGALSALTMVCLLGMIDFSEIVASMRGARIMSAQKNEAGKQQLTKLCIMLVTFSATFLLNYQTGLLLGSVCSAVTQRFGLLPPITATAGTIVSTISGGSTLSATAAGEHASTSDSTGGGGDGSTSMGINNADTVRSSQWDIENDARIHGYIAGGSSGDAKAAAKKLGTTPDSVAGTSGAPGADGAGPTSNTREKRLKKVTDFRF
jgi:hypothetical protein